MDEFDSDAALGPIPAAVLADLPVFPLPGLVLLPGGLLPLHFFEPRYRELAADCIASEERCLAIANIADAAAAGGSPPFNPRACAARILKHRQNDDGTFDVLLTGVARVFLDERPAGRAYRSASARVLPDRAPEAGLAPRDREVAWSLARDVARFAARRAPSFQVLAQEGDPDGLWVDRLGAQFVADPVARQELLETLDAGRRLDVVIRHLVELESQLRADLDGDVDPN